MLNGWPSPLAAAFCFLVSPSDPALAPGDAPAPAQGSEVALRITVDTTEVPDLDDWGLKAGLARTFMTIW